MRTRSQTKTHEKTDTSRIIYDNTIDFDDAILNWNANKKKLSDCCYSYICGKELKTGGFCQRSTNCRIHK